MMDDQTEKNINVGQEWAYDCRAGPHHPMAIKVIIDIRRGQIRSGRMSTESEHGSGYTLILLVKCCNGRQHR